MKTLDALSAELSAEILTRIRRADDNPLLKGLATQRKLTELHRTVVVNEKFIQLWDIVELLDSYLKIPSTDGRTDRQEMRKQLRKMIDKI